MVRLSPFAVFPVLCTLTGAFTLTGHVPRSRSPYTAATMMASRADGEGVESHVSSRRPSFERRQFVQTALSSAGFLALSAIVSDSAFAATSPIIDEIKVRESIKSVKESVDALQLYEDFVKQKDLYGIKKSLRVPPVSEIRRDCRRIIGGLEGPLKTDASNAYQRFIESLERVDLVCTRGIQGGKDLTDKESQELADAFSKTQRLLDDFMALVKSSRFEAE